jgi:DNA-binding response OmpR family regulator
MKILFIDIHTDSTDKTKGLHEDPIFSLNYVQSVSKASECIQLYEYDCIIFQYQQLNVRVKNLLTEIHSKINDTGLILVSDQLTSADKIQLLNAGADDCLAIPYDPQELKARTLAIIRRKKFNTRNTIHIANVVIDITAQSILVWDTPIILTPTEYDLFLFLIMNRFSTLSQTKLVDYLWGDAAEDKEAPNLLISHIKNLRKKLKNAKAELEIKNVYAVGYTLIEI